MQPPKSHLTPTVILDKNGKKTTVHKRANQALTSHNNLPAPSASVNSDSMPSSLERVIALATRKRDGHQAPKVDDLIRIHSAMAGSPTASISLADQAFISRMDRKQSAAFADALEDKEGFSQLLNEMRQRYTMNKVAQIAVAYEADLFVHPAPAGNSEEKRLKERLDRFDAAYTHLRRVDVLGVYYSDDLTGLPEKEQAVARDFFRFYSALYEIGQEDDFSHLLVDFVFKECDDPAGAIKAMRTSGSTDPNVVRGVMNGMEAPVAEGWL